MNQIKYAAPPIWKFFIAYCAAMALLYLLCAALGVLSFFFIEPKNQEEKISQIVTGALFIGLGAVLFLMFTAAPFLPKKPWVWVYDIVLIAFGLTSCLCLPVSIPLLIYWLKPEAKAFFGRS